MKKKQAGFSMIELMISVFIMVIILSVAAPNYMSWMGNVKVKGVGEGLHFAMLQAKAEAIKRNEYIKLVVNSDTTWQIVDKDGNILNKKGSDEATVGVALDLTGEAITFNGMGMVVGNEDGSVTLTSLDINPSDEANIGIVKSLRLQVNDGGTIFLCDTGIVDTANPAYCQTI